MQSSSATRTPQSQSTTTEKNDKIFVSVEGTGIGIPGDSIKKIWERFYKTDLSRGKDKKGTGLGLSIVKEIVQAHGENINCISTEGVGTEFIFTLPLAKKLSHQAGSCFGAISYTMRSIPLRFRMECLWNILFKKCGISNQPVTASAMIRVFPSLEHSGRGMSALRKTICRTFVQHLPALPQ